MDPQSLGKRLQVARQRAGLTQQELCQETGLAYSTLAKIERGAITSPSVFTVASIAAATNTPIEDLLANSNHDFPALSNKNRSKAGVSFVYFDVGSTLLSSINPAFTQIARDSGQSVDIVEMLFWRNHDAVATGRVGLDQFNQTMAEGLGLKHFDWQKYYLADTKPIKQAQDLLIWASQHYQVGLLTNNMAGVIANNLRKHLLPELDYQAIIDSSEVGVLKPDKQIYEIAQQRANAEPHEILLIDNEKPNLLGAQQAGWQAIWFDDDHPAQSAEAARKLLEF